MGREVGQRKQIGLFGNSSRASQGSYGRRRNPAHRIGVGPEMAKVFREVDRFRMNSMHTSAKCIAARGPLRVSTRQAGEFIWILASRTLPAVLCDEFGWTESQHARWLADPQPFESRGRR
jgi:hypothetical protein